MVSASMAKRILPHCPAGPALDILTSAAVNIPALAASPSADVIRKRIKAGVSLESLISLVEATDSAEILAEIVKKDKRLSVKRAAAENPALGPAEVERLKNEARARNDMKTLIALWDGRDVAGKLELLKEVPSLHWHVGNWTYALGAAVNRGGDAVLEHIVKNLDPGRVKDLLQNMCERQQVGATTAVKFAAIVSEYHPTMLERSNYRNVRAVVRSLIREGDDVTTWKKVLEIIPAIDLVLSSVEASGKGESRIPQAELFEYAENERQIEQVVHALTSNQVPIEAGTLEKALAVPGGCARQLSSATFTPEAVAHIAQHGNVELLGQKLWNVDIIQQRKYLEEVDGLIEYVHPSADSALALRAAGLQENLFWRLAQRCIDRYGQLRHAELRQLIIAEGPLEAVALLSLEVAELEDAMKRPDRDEVMPSVAKRLLGSVKDLPDDVRQEAQKVLPEEDVVHALNSMQVGDLTEYLETCDRGRHIALTEIVRRKVMVGEIGSWGAEAVRTLALEWKDISNEKAVRVMLEVLTQSFGEDREKWQTGLTLLAEWTGTLDELVETVELL